MILHAMRNNVKVAVKFGIRIQGDLVRARRLVHVSAHRLEETRKS